MIRMLLVFLFAFSAGAQSQISTNSPAHKTAALYQRGVNFGNHLEMRRFDENRYKESDYARVKAAGFDHIGRRF